jgi:hypothetical protein
MRSGDMAHWPSLMLVGVAVWALQASNLRPPPCKRQTNHSRLTHETATVVLMGLYATRPTGATRAARSFLGKFLGTKNGAGEFFEPCHT